MKLSTFLEGRQSYKSPLNVLIKHIECFGKTFLTKKGGLVPTNTNGPCEWLVATINYRNWSSIERITNNDALFFKSPICKS